MSEPFRFIDLFAGIGGIRLGLEAAGGRCVMTSEIDKFARQTYDAYFADDPATHIAHDDISAVDPANIPDHDLLAAGFPCQPFSLAGVSKKNSLGRAHGFDDPTKGTLFFNIKEILKARRPTAFLLENVKNLRSHNHGKTWQVVTKSLTNAGYSHSARILDAARVVPQHRERIFIVGISEEILPRGMQMDWSRFWQEVDHHIADEAKQQRMRYDVPHAAEWPCVDFVLEDDVPERYGLTPALWQYLQDYRRKHEAAGNGFGYGLVRRGDAVTRTISARYYKDGSEALVERASRPRRLTPRECGRLQGFPEEFVAMFDRTDRQPVSDTQAYKQFGNSVCVPIVRAIAQPLGAVIASPAAWCQLKPQVKFRFLESHA